MAFNNEIEEVKAQIQELQEKLQKLEEIEKQPRMNLQQEGEYAVVSFHDKVYYRLEGEVTFSWYIKKGVSVGYPVPTLMMVNDAETERLLEGLYYNHIQVKKEKEQRTKSPVKEAYKDWWGQYPETGNWDSNDDTRWAGFQAGYHFAYEEKVVEEPEEQVSFVPKEIKELVKEGMKWCEEHPDKDPLDWLKPQTPEQTEQGLKEAFREAVKQGVVSSTTKRQTLRDVCQDWWDDDGADTYCIDDLVDRIDKHFIPPSHDTNGYEWGKCLKMMRENLR